MKILKSFRSFFRIVIGLISFLVLFGIAIYNIADISKSFAAGISLYTTAGVIFIFLLWQWGGFDWIKNLLENKS